jgi:hypothetical protein
MDSSELHSVLIILHAVTATICFFAGCLLLFSPTYLTNQRIYAVYFLTLVAMTILLAWAIAVYWSEYSDVESIVFPGLLGLALFMLYRGWGAGLVLRTQQKDWKAGSIEHIGFTLISLFEGFIIVAGLDAGLPGWLVGVVAVAGLFGGRWIIKLAKRRTA